MKRFFLLCLAVIAMVINMSCTGGTPEDEIGNNNQTEEPTPPNDEPEDDPSSPNYDELPDFCDVSDSNGWSNIRYCKDGTTIFTKDNEGSSSVQKAFMLIPADTLGFASIYGEFDDDGFPKYIAFNDAIIFIDNRTETSFDASLIIGDVPVWTATDLKLDSEDTRAWGDNNWVRNTCAIGGVITSCIGIGAGVSLTATGVGTVTGVVTIATSTQSLVNNLETLFGPAQEESLTEDIMQRISDQGWDKVCDSLTEHENEFLDKWFKKHVGALDKLNWADITLGLIDDIWGKTITESQKKLALLYAHQSYKIETGVAKNITEHTAELWGYVSPEALFPLGEFANAEYGIILYPTDDPHNRTSKYDIVGKGGAFSLLFRGLEYDTEYSYLVYYHDKKNQVSRFGETRAFKTRGEDDLRDMLIKFYHDTGGDNWYNNENWCSDKPIDEWCGIMYELDADGNKYELTISLVNNNLTGSADLSNCTNLYTLFIPDNKLTSLNVSNCTSLHYVWCDNNHLTSFNVTGCPKLHYLGCSNNLLTSLNISSCTALQNLNTAYNKFYSLDVSEHPTLMYLDCGENPLTSLNITNCTNLEYLVCANTLLTSLDVSGCDNIFSIECYDTPITQEISSLFDSILQSYDERYTYYYKDINGKRTRYWKYNYADHHGWYYPDEPDGVYGGN